MQVKFWWKLALAGLIALAIFVSPQDSRSQPPLPAAESEPTARENVAQPPDPVQPRNVFEPLPQSEPTVPPPARPTLPNPPVRHLTVPPYAEPTIPPRDEPARQLTEPGLGPGHGAAEYYPPFVRTMAEVQVDPRKEALDRLNQLRAQLKASGPAQRDKMADQIKDALAQYFDADMKRRRAELDRLGGRVQQTDAQLTKRLTSRNELIDLQLRSFMFDAKGLDLLDGQTENATRLQNPLVIAKFKNVGSLDRQGQYGYAFSGGHSANVLKKEMERINAARQKLHAADNADDERVALEELKAALGAYFDSDMEFRRNEVAEIQKQLKQMEGRLNQRTNAKDAIVELHRQMILNEANGLGFFRSSATGDSFRLVNPASNRQPPPPAMLVPDRQPPPGR